ncbi:hypothetical protein, partial [Aureimonas sp. AU4]|uniref:hypothetical protein n=1 Tax=Aureimonas sp. AU4 TaxID=1638163 RepID=UPI000A785FBC
MLGLPKAGRMICVTALAASTALTGPLAALAQGTEAPPPAMREAPPEPGARGGGEPQGERPA